MKHALSSKELRWVNVQSPTPEELAEFIRETELEAAAAEYLARRYHRPGITLRENYILLLVQVPVFDRNLRLTKGVALFFVIKERDIYTLHYAPIISLDKIRRDFEESPDRVSEYFHGEALGLCLDLISLLYDGAFRKLERLGKHIDIAEDAVFQGNEKKMVEEISLLTRDVMDFRKVIRPQRNLFAEIPKYKQMGPEMMTKWVRVHDQLMKIWEILESMFESVKELSNTNFTLLQYKENELLRLLTVYSIIVIPMLIVTNPYFTPRGPGSTIIDSIAFWVVLGTLIVTLVGIFLRFRRK